MTNWLIKTLLLPLVAEAVGLEEVDVPVLLCNDVDGVVVVDGWLIVIELVGLTELWVDIVMDDMELGGSTVEEDEGYAEAFAQYEA